MITITCPGLDELTKTLEKQGKKLPAEYDTLIEGLVNEAKDVADAFYNTAAQYMPSDDFQKPSVFHEKMGECYYKLIAQGKEVCFYEFGAGMASDPSHPWAQEMPFEVNPGSWSKDHSRQFSDKGFWFYRKTSYSYIPATRAMYTAAQNMIRRLDAGDFEGIIK